MLQCPIWPLLPVFRGSKHRPNRVYFFWVNQLYWSETRVHGRWRMESDRHLASMMRSLRRKEWIWIDDDDEHATAATVFSLVRNYFCIFFEKSNTNSRSESFPAQFASQPVLSTQRPQHGNTLGLCLVQNFSIQTLLFTYHIKFFTSCMKH